MSASIQDWTSPSAVEQPDCPLAREEADARALQDAIRGGQAHQIMDMVREMDDVVHLLGIEDSFETPCEAIRKLMPAE